MLITTHVAVSPGVYPGMPFVLSGFTATGGTSINAKWTMTSVSGTGPYTLVGTLTGTCPTSITAEGFEASGGTNGTPGTNGTITLPNLTLPGTTGITTQNNQKFCALITENGADSPFPGSQAIAMVDDHGNPLPGSPALVPNLNQGTANFTGYITGASKLLTVTSMNSYTITGATFVPISGSTPAQVTFTTSTTPMFDPGSEFTVTGVTPAAYNHTYVAVGGTTPSSTTFTATPLSGSRGTPIVMPNPGTYASGGSMVSVIMPSMHVFGTNLLNAATNTILFNGTGTGGTGTYGLTAAPPIVAVSGNTIPAGGVMTITGDTLETIMPGLAFAYTDPVTGASTGFVTSFITGTGLNGTYQTTATNGSTGSITSFTGNTWSSASPGVLFAVGPFYKTAVGVASSAKFSTTALAQAAIGDFATAIGTSSTSIGGGRSRDARNGVERQSCRCR